MLAFSPQMRDTVINQLNGRGGKGSVGRGRKQVLSWIDAPDDVYFVATDATRSVMAAAVIVYCMWLSLLR